MIDSGHVVLPIIYVAATITTTTTITATTATDYARENHDTLSYCFG